MAPLDEIYYAVADRSDKQIQEFSNRYTHISELEIWAVFSHHGYRVTSMKKSTSWGTAHLVYFVEVKENIWSRKLVFRANAWKKWGFDTPEISMLSEKIITDAVRKMNISTNNILYVDISRILFPFDYQIEEVLEGVDPEQYIDSEGNFRDSREDYDRMSYQLWQTIAKYSELRYTGFGIFQEEAVVTWKIIWKDTYFYDYITTNLESHLDALIAYGAIDSIKKETIIWIYKKYKNIINDCESCLVHHDLADHNIMYNPVKKELSWIFDWEAMVLWDPMLDLWSCITWSTHYERKQMLIDGYSSIKKLPKDYEIRMNVYELRTWIWKIMFVIRMEFWETIKNSMLLKMHEVLQKFKNK